MGYRGVVKGNVVVLAEGGTLPEGTPVEVTPLEAPARGTSAALLEVWGSEVLEYGWDAVERAVDELDRTDRGHEKQQRSTKRLPAQGGQVRRLAGRGGTG